MYEKFWSIPNDKILLDLKTNKDGLTSEDTEKRLKLSGKNTLSVKKDTGKLALFFNQFKSPIVIILLITSILSYFLEDQADSFIILSIVFISSFLGYWQEKGATEAVKDLISVVKVRATVLRDKKECEILLENVVSGDIAILKAGDLVPGDCYLLEAKDLFVNEAALTGETYPVAKEISILKEDTPLSQRKNSIFMGTHVISGNAKVIVVNTGKETEIGKISSHLNIKPPETEFEKGIRHFGYLVMEVTLILVILIFAGNVYFHKPVLEAFLFSLALAVGLTPQLLPVIISINLAHGARKMAEKKVIVKQLPAIENFGSMNIFCSDKTGTLTEGVVKVKKASDFSGNENEKVLLYSYLNAFFESGYKNPIDEALRNGFNFKTEQYHKIDEIPYDFNRKRLSVLIDENDCKTLISKGALQNILSICTKIETHEGICEINSFLGQVNDKFQEFSAMGYRVLGIAYKQIKNDNFILEQQENELIFLGFLILEDPPKPKIKETVKQLKNIGVSLKMITGDNRFVASNVGSELGLDNKKIITGSELNKISNEALSRKVSDIDIFAEIEPNQKERIVFAYKRAGNVVGYIGDGINDVSALHAADVSISVDSAVDVAKETASIVMLDKDLKILIEGIKEGRRTFSNTLKYIFMATSANFGNMFSMAGTSLFLPFLPLLPKQILLTNLLTDFPEITIATDNVDDEVLEAPQRWNIKFIQKFMIMFGLISSFFDYLTFFVLLFLLHSNTNQFRTGWFFESVVSASLIVLIIRSKHSFYKSKPSKYLVIATSCVFISTLLLPFTPLAGLFGFSVIPIKTFFIILIIICLYAFTAEFAKKIFYKKIKLT